MALCLDLEMRSEHLAVGFFSLDPQPACLVTLLLARGINDSTDQGFVCFQSINEMGCDLRRNDASQQRRTERPMATCDVTVTKPANKIAAANHQRLGAIQYESA
jgi:hypothetical protein